MYAFIKNDGMKNILKKRKKVSWEDWKCSQSCNNTNRIILFHFLITFSQQYLDIIYIQMFAYVLIKKERKSPGF